MAVPVTNLKQVPSILALYIQDAERLIDLANESTRSFFVSGKDYQKGGPEFIGFLQDSLVREQDFRVSTGGISVAADLHQVDSYLRYLDRNGITSIEDLRKYRDESRNYVMEVADSASLNASASFASFSPLTYAVCASLANAGDCKRAGKKKAALFNAVNLNHFIGNGWPLFKNVDKPHPFIAFKVQRAATSLTSRSTAPLEDVMEALTKGTTSLAKKFGISVSSDEATVYIEEIRKNIADLEDLDEAERRIRQAHSDFRKQAEQYLWEQIGYAPVNETVRNYSVLYDPVGACYALNILLMSAQGESASGDPQKILGEQVNLVSRSIQHILEAMSPSGLFPYGVPFSYSTNGTAGFATSSNSVTAPPSPPLELEPLDLVLSTSSGSIKIGPLVG